MAYMKYIRFRDAGFVVFEQHQQHSDVAKKFPSDEVLSAGQVNLTCEPDQIGCYGDSVTLKTSAKDGDTDTLYRRLSIYI